MMGRRKARKIVFLYSPFPSPPAPALRVARRRLGTSQAIKLNREYGRFSSRVVLIAEYMEPILPVVLSSVIYNPCFPGWRAGRGYSHIKKTDGDARLLPMALGVEIADFGLF